MTRRRSAFAWALAALAAAGPAAAQSLDPASQDALNATIRILLDPVSRSAELAKNPQGAAVDQQVRGLAGSDALAQEFYAVAAEVMNDLTRGTGGDAHKMLEAAERAKTDPAAFAAMLSPATQQRLRDLAAKLSDQKR